MADDRIEVELLVDDQDAGKAFVKVEQGAKRAGKSLNTTFKQSFRLLTKEVLAFSGIFIGLFAGREILAAAGKQEEAITQLNTALKNAGTFSLEASQGVQAFATEIQNTTRFGDELILQQTALARNFARTNEEAVELTRAAVDLSEATGISLESAVRNLGKTFAGLTGELGESLPAIRTLTAEQLKNGEAIKLVSDLFGGTAAQNVQTFTGRIEQLSNNFGDLLEGVGQFVTALPIVSGLLGKISQLFSDTAKSLKSFTDSAEDIAALNNQVVDFGLSIVTFVIVPLEALVKATDAAFLSLQAGFETIIALGSKAVSAFLKLKNLVSGGGFELDPETAAVFEGIALGAEDTAIRANEAIASIGTVDGDDFSVKLAENLESFRVTAEEVQGTLNNLDFAPVTEQVKKLGFQFKITGKEIATGISQGVQQAVKNAKAGGSALEGFFGGFLAFIGNWAIQTGTTLIAVGLGIEALKSSILTLSGGQAIAAGIALVALGTLLSTLSSGGSQAAAAGGGVATDVGQGSGEVAVEAGEAETPITEVAINVEGTVLDPQTVGNQIAEILNDTFDAGGTRVRTV